MTNFWDKIAGVYDLAESINGDVYHEMCAQTERLVPAGAKVLDCAAGTGELSLAAAKNAASPPVAITVTESSPPYGFAAVSTSSRTSPIAPRSTPNRIDSIVPLPIRSGSSVENGTSGSCAVPAASACRISLRPGAIAPPRKIRSASTTSSVIAVPQSTAIAGSGWNAASAIALATRSAPDRKSVV